MNHNNPDNYFIQNQCTKSYYQNTNSCFPIQQINHFGLIENKAISENQNNFFPQKSNPQIDKMRQCSLQAQSTPGNFMLGRQKGKLEYYGYNENEIRYIATNNKIYPFLKQFMEKAKFQFESDSSLKIDVYDYFSQKNISEYQQQLSTSNLSQRIYFWNYNVKLIQNENNSHNRKLKSMIENNNQNRLNQDIIYQNEDQNLQVSDILEQFIKKLTEKENIPEIDIQNVIDSIEKLILDKYGILLSKSSDIQYDKKRIAKQINKPFDNQFTNNQFRLLPSENIYYERKNNAIYKDNNIFRPLRIERKEWGLIRYTDKQMQYQGNIENGSLWNDLILRINQTNEKYGFDVIVMDPPWDSTALNLPYQTLTDIQWMNKIPIQKMQKAGYLFIWITNGKLESALKFLEENGYKRVDMIAWIKMKCDGQLYDSIGYYFRHMFELCIVGRKIEKEDQWKKISQLHKAPDLIIDERRQTSRKPDQFYYIVETLVPKGNYLEIFGRQYNQRNNWITVGDESINLRRKVNLKKYTPKKCEVMITDKELK